MEVYGTSSVAAFNLECATCSSPLLPLMFNASQLSEVIRWLFSTYTHEYFLIDLLIVGIVSPEAPWYKSGRSSATCAK
jgi:hypothetical protein